MTDRKPKIVFLDAGSVDLGDLDLKRLKKQGTYVAYDNSLPHEIVSHATGATILIANKSPLKESILHQLPELKLICVAATGVNNIDLETARRLKVAVTNVRGYSTDDVAEHTLMMLLAFSHRLLEHHEASLNGAWSQSPHFALLNYPHSLLREKTLGLIGYGTIGRKVARFARLLGMKVLVAKLPGRKYSQEKERHSLQTIFKKSDFISIHSALTPETQNLVNEKNLSLMKPTAFLLNLGRGPIVDEVALAQALHAGKLAGYGTDVLSQEPPAADHPLLQITLRNKVLITPHIAWAARESRQKLMDEIALNIEAFKKGKKRNRVA